MRPALRAQFTNPTTTTIEDAGSKGGNEENQPATVHEVEIIEISSDEDLAPPAQSSTKRPVGRHSQPSSLKLSGKNIQAAHPAEWERQLEHLKQQNHQLQSENARHKEDIATLKELYKARQGMVYLNFNDDEDLLSCEVCSNTMWSPYM
ncbi:hypothetical protein VKT23_006400 [Stygiomarasmius scandens]|uniref:Uncharacterized protein n=1 Tax=Marasmiellus scandens TaxID=2682957 RepID=A0ABR1JR01_9AGAR